MGLVRAFRRSWFGRQLKGLGTAVLDTWFYSAVGTGVGLLLVVVSERLREPWSRITEHLGMGMVVSAIAVVLYEWRSDKKKTFDLTNKLVSLLASHGEDALDRALGELLGGDAKSLPEGVHDVSFNCRTVVVSMAGLLRNNDRVSKQYVNFVSSLLRLVVSKNAQALKNLGTVPVIQFSVPANAAVMADDILAAQMEAMLEGDRYDVISDLLSWQANQLTDFQAATQASVHRGVKVRRIFNLLRDENKGLGSGQVKDILKSHMAAMQAWRHDGAVPGYEVRVIGHEEGMASGNSISDDNLRREHYGVFCLGEEDQAFQFRVMKPDLSEIMISRDLDDIRNNLKFFEHLWGVASPLAPDLIERVSRRFEKVRSMRRGTKK